MNGNSIGYLLRDRSINMKKARSLTGSKALSGEALRSQTLLIFGRRFADRDETAFSHVHRGGGARSPFIYAVPAEGNAGAAESGRPASSVDGKRRIYLGVRPLIDRGPNKPGFPQFLMDFDLADRRTQRRFTVDHHLKKIPCSLFIPLDVADFTSVSKHRITASGTDLSTI